MTAAFELGLVTTPPPTGPSAARAATAAASTGPTTVESSAAGSVAPSSPTATSPESASAESTAAESTAAVPAAAEPAAAALVHGAVVGVDPGSSAHTAGADTQGSSHRDQAAAATVKPSTADRIRAVAAAVVRRGMERGEFLFIFIMWAIRLTACFVYS